MNFTYFFIIGLALILTLVAAATKVKADAQAEANEKLNKSISKNLIDYEIANKWNGELPKVSGSNGTLINSDSLLNGKN